VDQPAALPGFSAAARSCAWRGSGFLLVVDGVFAIAYRDVVKRVDWALILVFILMFIDLRLLAEWAPDTGDPRRQHRSRRSRSDFFSRGWLISQVISNVPGAILLAEHSADWRVIAWAVNVGGFGFADRLTGQPHRAAPARRPACLAELPRLVAAIPRDRRHAELPLAVRALTGKCCRPLRTAARPWATPGTGHIRQAAS
jgi:hypothetical protein